MRKPRITKRIREEADRHYFYACVVHNLFTDCPEIIPMGEAIKELAACMGGEDFYKPHAEAAIERIIELGCIHYYREKKGF